MEITFTSELLFVLKYLFKSSALILGSEFGSKLFQIEGGVIFLSYICWLTQVVKLSSDPCDSIWNEDNNHADHGDDDDHGDNDDHDKDDNDDDGSIKDTDLLFLIRMRVLMELVSLLGLYCGSTFQVISIQAKPNHSERGCEGHQRSPDDCFLKMKNTI